MNSKFIVLEGLSGTGKTFLGKILSRKIGAKFYTTPSSLFSNNCGDIDRNADISARFLFYIAGVI